MKKVLLMLVIVCVCVAMLASCSNEANYSKDPIALASLLDNKERDIEIYIDKEDIDDTADSFDVRANGISCIVMVENSNDDEYGIFIYCEENDDAEIMFEDLEEELEDQIEEYSKQYGASVVAGAKESLEQLKAMVVGRYNKLVFAGSENLWDEVPKKTGIFAGLGA